jgi:prepilin-type N-terminal cleavage/methylation domain-containing protein
MNNYIAETTEYNASRRNLAAVRSARRAFTLIELIIVIALTAVLSTLLFVPLIQGFRYTSQAQTIAAAQDGQRLLLREISRDLASAAGVRNTQACYLNVNVLQKSSAEMGTKSGTQALAHLYNAYFDIVPPMPNCQNQTGSTCSMNGSTVTIVTDPTTKQTVIVRNKSASASGSVSKSGDASQATYVETPSLVAPIAPSSTFTRYFVGLKFPFNLSYNGTGTASPQPYQSIYDNQWESTTDEPASSPFATNDDVATRQLDNTYVLYVANVSPYKMTSSGSIVNTDLFEKTSSGAPYLDDPDFFRIVTAGDYLPTTSPDYTSSNTTYGGALAAAHNVRVYNWYKISHQEITGREYDLLQYARTSGNVQWGNAATLASTAINPFTGSNYGYVGEYSNATGTTAYLLTDTVNKVNGSPVLQVRSAFSILPSSVGGENAKVQASDDSANGAQFSSYLLPGAQYVPSLYNMTYGQIQGVPNIVVDPAPTTLNNNVYGTRIATVADAAANSSISQGDMVQVVYTKGASISSGTVVYDITQGIAIGSIGSIPFSYNSNSGSINFSTQVSPPANTSFSADPTNSLNPWWAITLSSLNTYDTVTGEVVIDLFSSAPNGSSSLTSYMNAATLFGTGNPITSNFGANASASTLSPPYQMVVGSERIKGPDRSANGISNSVSTGATGYGTTTPNVVQYPLIPYTRVPYGTPVGINQYSIEYLHPFVNNSGAIVYAPRIHLGAYSDWQSHMSMSDPANFTVMLAFGAQNNIAWVTPSANSGSLPSPAVVTATYSSGANFEVTVGLRVYDITSQLATTLSVAQTASVGNGTR